MSAIERITKAAHLIDMNDIIREGNPTLRAVAEEVTFPLSDQEIILGEKMMQFLKHSQDPVMAKKMEVKMPRPQPNSGIKRKLSRKAPKPSTRKVVKKMDRIKAFSDRVSP